MTIQTEIDELIAKAEPYRALDDDDPKKAPLAGIVDEINELRRVMGEMRRAGIEEVETPQPVALVIEGADARFDDDEVEVLKRKPGRPRKDAQ